ncbi:MAG TPA: hypothetical protein VFK47_01850, partial [Ktedonobacteraceae bacterium]|nr:hypothetical protein [Ktedonobacteraceae bacterium]
MPRLPISGSDTGTWGDILNDFLSQTHNADGTLKDNSITASMLADNAVDSSSLSASSVTSTQLADGSVTRSKLSTSSSPTSGQVLSYNGTTLAWATVSGSGSVPDADASTKGLIQLAGDLGGSGSTAAAPVISAGAITAAKLATGTITNTQVSSSAAIAYSKLALGSSVVNADVSSSAAIAYSKLALGSSIVNADVSSSAAIAYSKLALSGSIVDADVSSSAAIAQSKISGLSTALSAKATDSAVVHNTGAETVAGVKTFSSSPVVPTPTNSTDAATKTYVDTTSASAAAAILPSQTGNNGKYLTTNGTSASWGTVASSATWGSITGTLSSQTDLNTALSAKAIDTAVVHNTGAETVAGVKTFSSSPIVPTPTT